MRVAVSLALAALMLNWGEARAGETGCWIDRGVLIVPAALGAIAGDFILDLSAGRSVLHYDRATAEGIDAPAAAGPLRLAGQVIPASFEVLSLDARTLGLPATINGLIGADALAGYVVDIRFSPCRVRLWRGRAPPIRTAATLPIEMVAGVPSIAATISDGRTARAGRFAIDTGTAAVRLSGKIAGLSRTPTGIDPASRLEPPARLNALGLAGGVRRRLPAALEDDLPSTLTGGVGLAAWSGYEMRIDLPGRRLRLAATASDGVSARRLSRPRGSSGRGSPRTARGR